MDPFSVSTACVGLLAAVAQLSVQTTQFVSGVREARRDMDSVSRELSSLALCLETLRDDSTKIQYPDGLRQTLVAVLKNCDAVTQQMHGLLEKMSSNSLGRRAQWVATGRDEMNRLRSSLEAYKSALDIALEMTAISIISAVKDDVKDVKADTTAIKEDTFQIAHIKQDTSSLIQEIQFLRLQVTELQHHDTGGGVILQRFLQESTTYTETVIDGLDNREDSIRSQTPRHSLEEPAVGVIRLEDSVPFSRVAESGQAQSNTPREETTHDESSHHARSRERSPSHSYSERAEQTRRRKLAIEDEFRQPANIFDLRADSKGRKLYIVEQNDFGAAEPEPATARGDHYTDVLSSLLPEGPRETADLEHFPTGGPPESLQFQSDPNANYSRYPVEQNAYGRVSSFSGHGPPLPPKISVTTSSRAVYANQQPANILSLHSYQGHEPQSVSRQPSSQSQMSLSERPSSNIGQLPSPSVTTDTVHSNTASQVPGVLIPGYKTVDRRAIPRKLPDGNAMMAATALRNKASERARKMMDERLGDLIRGKKSIKHRLTKQRDWVGEIVGGVAEIQVVLDAGGIISNAEKPNRERNLSETLMAELHFHKRQEVIELLLSYGALEQDPSILAYRTSIWECPIPIMRCLLEYWYDPNILDGDRGTALFNTVHHGAIVHVSLLLGYGADPNLDIGAHRYGHNQGSPLNVACYCAHVDIAKMLLENGADVNKAAGWPALTPVQNLLKRAKEKAQISSLDHFGVAIAELEKIKEILKSYGADVVEFERFQEMKEIARIRHGFSIGHLY